MKLNATIIVVAIILSVTLLVALNKLPGETIVPVVTGLLGWLIPSPSVAAKAKE